jgi:uncharacterized phiE125 gp8 family phage protein
MAAQDLTTLANVKLWLPINTSNTNDDATIGRLITAVSQDFMRATNRPDLLQADYTEVHQGDGSTRMIVFHWPINAIASLTVAGNALLASADKIAVGYYFDADIDPERIWNIYLNGYTFVDGAAVALDYTAGYVQPGGTVETGEIALPEDIEQAVIDWCAYRYKNRPNVGVTARRTTEGESSQIEQLDAPPNVLQVIERYKRRIPSVDRRYEEQQMHMSSGRRVPRR